MRDLAGLQDCHPDIHIDGLDSSDTYHARSTDSCGLERHDGSEAGSDVEIHRVAGRRFDNAENRRPILPNMHALARISTKTPKPAVGKHPPPEAEQLPAESVSMMHTMLCDNPPAPKSILPRPGSHHIWSIHVVNLAEIGPNWSAASRMCRPIPVPQVPSHTH